ncbi:MAG: raffinose/stachyose/melibiose transport system permease protein, partial [Kribbellaceae bacterium]|nr:raffinose/stachyose/melibiose transport system permease protein [Kribbellaceae bacterium]
MRTRYRPRTALLEIVMVALAVAFLFPVYALVTLAFKDPGQIANKPLSLPDPPSVGSFGTAWQSASLGSALLNSTLITVASVLALIVLGSLAAYFLAR